jgi:hypothetical protein
VKNVFDQILTVQEAAERYRMNPKSIQQILWKGQVFEVGRDCCLKGHTWLILDSAARRLWGYRLVTCPPGYRVCRKCLAVYPETDEHFKPYRIKDKAGLGTTCRGCLTLENAAYYQKRKAALRPYRKAYARTYRAKYPEREAAAVKRYKLKRSIKRMGVVS